jgi:Cation transporting ATPase, C-terminus
MCLTTVSATQGPATSLAYEPAEANVMDRPPRDIATERLVSLPLLLYAYLIAGIPESLCCFGAYLWTFHHYGIAYGDIFLLDPKKDTTWLTSAERNEATAHGFSPDEQAHIVRQARAPTSRLCTPPTRWLARRCTTPGCAAMRLWERPMA